MKVEMVRAAELDELDDIANLMRRSVEGLSEGFYDDRQRRLAARYLTVPDRVLIADGTYFVALDAGAIVGCGGWSARRKLFTGSDDQEALSAGWLDPSVEPGKIRAFFVAPEAARRGVGRALYKACEESARNSLFTAFELMATLPGVPFYERLGFKRIEEEDILLPSGDFLPCVRMIKAFA